MPSKSKSQQRFFGMVDAYKKGELKNPGSKVKKAAKGMSMDDVKDFAETKHKGLPEKVEENMKKQIIRLTESDLHQIVKESVNKILTELDWKTYANAARKADDRAMAIARKPENAHLAVYQYNDDNKKNYEKNARRSWDFTRAAKKSFDREHGYDDGTTKVESDYDLLPMLNGVGGFENGGKEKVGTWDPIEGEYVGGHYEPNIGSRFWGKGKPDTFYNGGLSNKDAHNAYLKAKEEMGDYYKGKYDYQKGKGWAKK